MSAGLTPTPLPTVAWGGAVRDTGMLTGKFSQVKTPHDAVRCRCWCVCFSVEAETGLASQTKAKRRRQSIMTESPRDKAMDCDGRTVEKAARSMLELEGTSIVAENQGG